MTSQITLSHYVILSAALFSLGILAVLTRRNAVLVLMGIELILNAANINFIAFSRFGGMNLDGQAVAIFVIILAAAEAAVALGIILAVYANQRSIDVSDADTLRD